MDNKTYIYSDGTEYNGEWKDNKRHGYGVWVRPDGTRYEGEWGNDKPNGQGTLTFPKGKKRSGLWENGKFIEEQLSVEHKGNSITKSLGRTEEKPPPVINKGIDGDLPYVKNATIAIYGGTYTGELLNNKPHGQGILTHSDGNEYTGSWRDGKPNGRGKIIYSNGGLYEGSIKNGKLDGIGCYLYPDGRRIKGNWKDGKLLSREEHEKSTNADIYSHRVQDASLITKKYSNDSFQYFSDANKDIKCPFCAKMINFTAEKCKHCHSVIIDDLGIRKTGMKQEIPLQNVKDKKQFWKKPWTWVLIVLLSLISVVVLITTNLVINEDPFDIPEHINIGEIEEEIDDTIELLIKAGVINRREAEELREAHIFTSITMWGIQSKFRELPREDQSLISLREELEYLTQKAGEVEPPVMVQDLYEDYLNGIYLMEEAINHLEKGDTDTFLEIMENALYMKYDAHKRMIDRVYDLIVDNLEIIINQ